jgi:hypothetical protein
MYDLWMELIHSIEQIIWANGPNRPNFDLGSGIRGSDLCRNLPHFGVQPKVQLIGRVRREKQQS